MTWINLHEDVRELFLDAQTITLEQIREARFDMSQGHRARASEYSLSWYYRNRARARTASRERARLSDSKAKRKLYEQRPEVRARKNAANVLYRKRLKERT